MRTLSFYTSNNDEKRILDILCSQEGKLDYENLFIKLEKNLIDILQELASCTPPISVLVEHLTRLMPRPYSIASSPLGNANKIRIVFSMHEKKDHGVTTTYLQNLLENSYSDKYLKFYIRTPTKFRFIENTNKNVIMIGPGTGISPFLGFLEHRNLLSKRNPEILSSSWWLFTGNRYFQKNFLYSNILNEYKNAGVLTKFFCAFSRDNDSKFKYVQDLIRNVTNEFSELFMNDNTIVFLCGEGKKMLPDIENEIVKCLMIYKKLPEDECRNIIVNRKNNRQYIEDIWF